MIESKNISNKIPLIVGSALALCVVFLAGMYVGYARIPVVDRIVGVSNKDSVNIASSTDFSIFWQAWQTIDERYVSSGSTTKKITDQEKVYGAVAGLTKSLGDPYSVFFTPEEDKIFQGSVNNEFDGVGMEIGIKDGVITVVAPLKDTPAYKAGVKAGDKIVKIGEKPTDDMSTDKAVMLIRGPRGTDITLTFYRDGVGQVVKTLTRDTIRLPTIEMNLDSSGKAVLAKGESGTGLRPDGVFVIRLYNFGGNSPQMFQKALQKFIDSGSDKLIVDLRGNPGGYLDAAVDMASWFLPKTDVVVRESSGGRKPDVSHYSKGYDIFTDKLKMIVLVDKGSASAAEILAGALSEYGKAKLVGEKTFGKGSVQELIQLPGGASVKLTVARWYTPKGKSLSNGGLKPDYDVAPAKDGAPAGSDPQLDKAVQLLLR